LELAGYQFGEVIGEGGMATVYQGLQLSLQRRVAIKVLNEQLRTETEVREAFEREALIIAHLSHPNIIPVIDRGVSSQGAPCFVMEYVDGVDLARVMREGTLSLNRKLEILLQVARALAYAHRNAVIHRDIKPNNIIVDKDWHVRVVDFGIAMLYGDSDEANGGSAGESEGDVESRLIMGTEAYMAPESRYCSTGSTALSDLYAFGVVAFELLTGVLPNRGIKPPSQYCTEISSDLDRLILECLAPDPAQRPQRAEFIGDRLLLALNGAHIDKKQAARAQQVAGRKSFKLLDVLAESTDRASYLFLETKTQHRYVVKKLPAAHPSLGLWKQMAQLQHPRWVKVHGVSQNVNSAVVVSDYMPGGSLAERMSGLICVQQFVGWGRQIAAGLAYAHDNGVHHGGIDESCVFFDQNQGLQLAGFGDAADDDTSAQKRMKTGERLWSDINACGRLFYRMLIGEEPRYHHQRLKLGRAFSRLPKPLQQLLNTMLSTQQLAATNLPTAQVMKDVSDKLARYENDMPTQVWPATQPSTKATQQVQSEQKKWLLFLLLVLLFLVLMDVGVITLFHMGLL